MQTYQTPLKNPAAASLSLLMGLIVIAAIVLSLRVANSDQLSKKIEIAPETLPIDSSVPETTATNTLRENVAIPTPSEQTTPAMKPTAPKNPIPVPIKSNRTTRNS